MMNRSVSFSDRLCMGNTVKDISLSFPYGFDERHTFGQVGRNGAGKRTARTVRTRAFNTFPLKIVDFFTVKQNICSIVRTVPAFDQDRP